MWKWDESDTAEAVNEANEKVHNLKIGQKPWNYKYPNPNQIPKKIIDKNINNIKIENIYI